MNGGKKRAQSPRTSEGPVTPTEVLVCVFPLNDRDEPLSHWTRMLDAQDRSRAEAFRFRADRERFQVTRGALRVLLGRELGEDPASLTFHLGPWGKPHLPEDPLQFSVAHSRDWAAIAITRAPRVGIDIEPIRAIPDLPELAVTAFADEESGAIRALPPTQRQEAFFRVWTRKEAVAKALGEGLRAMKGFVVSEGPEPRVLHLFGDPTEVERWSLLDLDDIPGHAGSLAVEAKDLQVRAVAL